MAKVRAHNKTVFFIFKVLSKNLAQLLFVALGTATNNYRDNFRYTVLTSGRDRCWLAFILNKICENIVRWGKLTLRLPCRETADASQCHALLRQHR